MKLAIFGGTGGTGSHIVKHALDAGHEVTMLARTPSKMTIQHENLNIIQGDVTDAAAVEKTVAGADAVISALAPPNNEPAFVVHTGTQHILRSMQKHDVQRLVVSAGAGVRMPEDKPAFIDHFITFLLRTFSKNAVDDIERTVHTVMKSDRDWVVARAPRLTNQPATKNITVGYLGADGLSTSLTREDFAIFMLQQVTEDTWLRQAPVLSN